LIGRIQKLPGIRFAGATSAIPLGGLNGSGTVTVDSQSVPKEDTDPEADQRSVTSGYFQAMGISLVRGRFFEDRDADTAPPVAIVDESLAQTFWPNQDPIGKRVHMGGPESTRPWATVIGVVRQVHNRTLEMRSRVEVYWPENQRADSAMTLAILTSGSPMSLAPTVQREVAAIDPELPVYRVRSMSEVMGESVARRRLALILLSIFAGLALLLASVGIYGVTSYVVTQRQQEIGLRMALGASARNILRMVFRQGMLQLGIGLAVGIAGAVALTRFLSSLLVLVSPTDPVTFAFVAAVLGSAAVLGCAVPARRATWVDPLVALRHE
jgi:predicted permease